MERRADPISRFTIFLWIAYGLFQTSCFRLGADPSKSTQIRGEVEGRFLSVANRLATLRRVIYTSYELALTDRKLNKADSTRERCLVRARREPSLVSPSSVWRNESLTASATENRWM